MREHKRITSRTYANLFKITERMARNDLKEAVNKKLLKKRVQ